MYVAACLEGKKDPPERPQRQRVHVPAFED